MDEAATRINQKYIIYSISCVISKYLSEVTARHARKYNSLLNKINAENGVQSNPNNAFWNLSSLNVTDKDYGVLVYSLTLPGLGEPSRSTVNFRCLYPKNEKC